MYWKKENAEQERRRTGHAGEDGEEGGGEDGHIEMGVQRRLH